MDQTTIESLLGEFKAAKTDFEGAGHKEKKKYFSALSHAYDECLLSIKQYGVAVGHNAYYRQKIIDLGKKPKKP